MNQAGSCAGGGRGAACQLGTSCHQPAWPFRQWQKSTEPFRTRHPESLHSLLCHLCDSPKHLVRLPLLEVLPEVRAYSHHAALLACILSSDQFPRRPLLLCGPICVCVLSLILEAEEKPRSVVPEAARSRAREHSLQGLHDFRRGCGLHPLHPSSRLHISLCYLFPAPSQPSCLNTRASSPGTLQLSDESPSANLRAATSSETANMCETPVCSGNELFARLPLEVIVIPHVHGTARGWDPALSISHRLGVPESLCTTYAQIY